MTALNVHFASDCKYSSVCTSGLNTKRSKASTLNIVGTRARGSWKEGACKSSPLGFRMFFNLLGKTLMIRAKAIRRKHSERLSR